MQISHSKTLENLKKAFALQASAERRYRYFAEKADIEGFNDVAAVLRQTAESERAAADRLLGFLETAGDPATGKPMDDTKAALLSAIAAEIETGRSLFVDMAETARAEGLDEIADFFARLAKADTAHASRFQKTLSSLG